MSRITIYLSYAHIFVQTDCRFAILESKIELIYDCILSIRNKCSGSIRNALSGNTYRH